MIFAVNVTWSSFSCAADGKLVHMQFSAFSKISRLISFVCRYFFSCENFFFCVWLVLRNPFRMRHRIHSSVLFNPLDNLRPVKILVLFVHSAFELCLTKWCLHVLVILLQCSQEVDEYDSFYRNNMESLGYSGIYIQRTGQRKRDGCAIFYKPSWYDKNIKRDKTLT